MLRTHGPVFRSGRTWARTGSSLPDAAEQAGASLFATASFRSSSARRFYLKYGFVPLLDDQHHLFLPLSVIRKLKLPRL